MKGVVVHSPLLIDQKKLGTRSLSEQCQNQIITHRPASLLKAPGIKVSPGTVTGTEIGTETATVTEIVTAMGILKAVKEVALSKVVSQAMVVVMAVNRMVDSVTVVSGTAKVVAVSQRQSL